MAIVLDGTTGITSPAADFDGNVTLGSSVLVTPTGDAPSYTCRAWVNFDGTKDTTGATSTANTNRLIRGSGNVASVLRNAAGNYTVNFTTAMPDANYSAVVTTGSSGTSLASTPYTGQHSGTGTTSFATGAYQFWSRQGASGADTDLLTVCIFR